MDKITQEIAQAKERMESSLDKFTYQKEKDSRMENLLVVLYWWLKSDENI